MRTNLSETLGKNIAMARKNAGMTQETLAATIDVNPRSLQAFEAGDDLPRYITLFEIAHALKVEPADLINSMWKSWLVQHTNKSS